MSKYIAKIQRNGNLFCSPLLLRFGTTDRGDLIRKTITENETPLA